MRRRRQSTSGFTLVELAIVMIIIGLLIGGILKGQQLIETSRINNVIAQVNAIKTASLSFRDIYRYYPGDHLAATTSVPGCVAANFCVNGNGNQRVGTPRTTAGALYAKVYTDSETVQFWKHLAIADLLSGINLAADPATPVWGVTHPKSALGGGFEIFYESFGLIDSPGGPKGQFLRLSNNGLHPTLQDDNGMGIISPHMMSAIESKIDDGMPTTGDVITWDVGNFGCDNLMSGEPGIDPTITNKSCVAFFRMGKGY